MCALRYNDTLQRCGEWENTEVGCVRPRVCLLCQEGTRRAECRRAAGCRMLNAIAPRGSLLCFISLYSDIAKRYGVMGTHHHAVTVKCNCATPRAQRRPRVSPRASKDKRRGEERSPTGFFCSLAWLICHLATDERGEGGVQ